MGLRGFVSFAAIVRRQLAGQHGIRLARIKTANLPRIGAAVITTTAHFSALTRNKATACGKFGKLPDGRHSHHSGYSYDTALMSMGRTNCAAVT